MFAININNHRCVSKFIVFYGNAWGPGALFPQFRFGFAGISLLFFLITVKKTKINFEIPTFYLQCPKNNHPLFCTKPRVCIEKKPPMK